jgi:hypothetical protein
VNTTTHSYEKILIKDNIIKLLTSLTTETAYKDKIDFGADSEASKATTNIAKMADSFKAEKDTDGNIKIS